jgi:hypothetical protein
MHLSIIIIVVNLPLSYRTSTTEPELYTLTTHVKKSNHYMLQTYHLCFGNFKRRYLLQAERRM